MTKLTRHVGKIANTGYRVVVVYRTIPDEHGNIVDPDNCLIIQSQQIPDMYHENLMSVVEGKPAQETHNLYEVLHRSTFGDGLPMLKTLHERGYLRKMPVDNIVLYPIPNHPLPLREANNSIDGTDNASTILTEDEAAPIEDIKTDSGSIAAGLVAQAEMLEAEANNKRDEAYLLDPSLKPKQGRPVLTDEERANAKAKRAKAARAKRAEDKRNKLQSEAVNIEIKSGIE